MSGFPTSPSGLTPGAIAAWLGAAGVRPAAVTARPVGHPGEASQTVRLHLGYAGQDDGRPATLIAKFAAARPETRELADGAGAYRREVRFYADLAGDAGIPVPQCFFAAYDRATRTFLLLLEDLGAGRVGSVFGSSTVDVEAALVGVAGMHARWWDSDALRRVRWLLPFAHRLARSFRAEQVGRALRGEGALRLPLSAGTRDLLQRFVAAPDPFFDAATSLPPTLNHGDFHAQNVFFPVDGAGRFAVFDWQLVDRGFAGRDVAEMVVTGLDPVERRDREADLLLSYREALAAAGVVLSPEDVHRQYVLGIMATAVHLLGVIPDLDPRTALRIDPATGLRFAEVLAERVQVALEDHAPPAGDGW